MGFILDQTVGLDKSKRVFSCRFIESGDNLTCGTGVKKGMAIYTIVALEAKGIIAVDRTDTSKGGIVRFESSRRSGCTARLSAKLTTPLRRRRSTRSMLAQEKNGLLRKV